MNNPRFLIEQVKKLIEGESMIKLFLNVCHALLQQNSLQISSSVLAESFQSLQTGLEQRYLVLLRAIENGDAWEADEFNQFIRCYRITYQLPESQCSNSFTQTVVTTLEIVLERALDHLSHPSKWSQLIYSELERKGQQVTDDCELIRALANSQAVKLLDKTLDQWSQSYCRLFVPMPPQSKSKQVMYLAEIYEQVLSQCGNTFQQTQITVLAQLRTGQRFAELNLSCTTALQKFKEQVKKIIKFYIGIVCKPMRDSPPSENNLKHRLPRSLFRKIYWSKINLLDLIIMRLRYRPCERTMSLKF
jgi:hypothetical protein